MKVHYLIQTSHRHVFTKESMKVQVKINLLDQIKSSSRSLLEFLKEKSTVVPVCVTGVWELNLTDVTTVPNVINVF